MFEPVFLDQVRTQNDIVSLIGGVVKLRKAGKDHMGLCPFHTEKSPSFTVSESKQFYHCFGCAAHGDVIKWEMDYGGLAFVDAVEKLARGAGLTLPEQAVTSEEVKAQHARVASVQGILRRASLQFQADLKSAPDAVSYLRDQRGVTGQTAKRFGIGWASAGIARKLQDIDSQQLVEAGLMSSPEDGKPVRDRFHDRIMFPIMNEHGEPVGFGGRVLDSREPKYLNSAESEIFHKGHELYGLDLAKPAIRQARIAVVVEGYMDVVMLHQHGDERAVAALGTSLTEHHATRLFRLADEVVFVFDGDKAGRAASDRAARIALQIIPEGKRASFAKLSEEHDPDSYVRAHGIGAWQVFLREQAVPLSRKVLDMLVGGRDLTIAENRASVAAAAEELLGTIRHARLYQGALAGEVEALVGLRPTLASQVQAVAADRNGGPGPSASLPRPNPDRSVFYRQYALLCALDMTMIQEVPEAFVDGFAALVSGWFACAPVDMKERIVALSSVRDGALRRVIGSALEGVRERAAFLNVAQLRAEVDAISDVIQAEQERIERQSKAAELFAV
jgi:DNA primase